jgi:hypothetical protein
LARASHSRLLASWMLVLVLPLSHEKRSGDKGP